MSIKTHECKRRSKTQPYLLHNASLPLGECGIPPQLVVDELHLDLDSSLDGRRLIYFATLSFLIIFTFVFFPLRGVGGPLFLPRPAPGG